MLRNRLFRIAHSWSKPIMRFDHNQNMNKLAVNPYFKSNNVITVFSTVYNTDMRVLVETSSNETRIKTQIIDKWNNKLRDADYYELNSIFNKRLNTMKINNTLVMSRVNILYPDISELEKKTKKSEYVKKNIGSVFGNVMDTITVVIFGVSCFLSVHLGFMYLTNPHDKIIC